MNSLCNLYIFEIEMFLPLTPSDPLKCPGSGWMGALGNLEGVLTLAGVLDMCDL